MTKGKKTKEKYEDEKIEKQKAIKYWSYRQEIRKNMDLSVLKLSSGILEFLPSIFPEEIFYLGKCVNMSRDLFLIWNVAFYSVWTPFFKNSTWANKLL